MDKDGCGYIRISKNYPYITLNDVFFKSLVLPPYGIV